MKRNIYKLGILTALAGVLLLAIALLAFSYTEVGVTEEIWTEGLTLSVYNFSDVPQSVAEDAARLATEQFGDAKEKSERFVNQLLKTYIEAKDKDLIVIFNSGGWGWNLPEKSPGWTSILAGIKSELDSLGYESLLLNYRRTSETMLGCIKEFVEVTIEYPSKAKDLAVRLEFLTGHIPDLKVIVAGESNGTVISDSAMNILRDNPRVYSIQTGTPFWHESAMLDRTLVLNSNGTCSDSFSQGDIPVILWATVKFCLGLSSPEENPGHIIYYLRAPGHDYSWQYPEVYSRIVTFLERNFVN